MTNLLMSEKHWICRIRRGRIGRGENWKVVGLCNWGRQLFGYAKRYEDWKVLSLCNWGRQLFGYAKRHEEQRDVEGLNSSKEAPLDRTSYSLSWDLCLYIVS